MKLLRNDYIILIWLFAGVWRNPYLFISKTYPIWDYVILRNSFIIPVQFFAGMWCNDVEKIQKKTLKKNQQSVTSLLGLFKAYGFKANNKICCFNILRLKSFKVCCLFVLKNCFQAFETKRFINLIILKLLMSFLHYVMTMSAFQADRPACTIAQVRKFVYQALHEKKICIRKQKHEKCNFLQSPNNEAAKRHWDHQNSCCS